MKAACQLWIVGLILVAALAPTAAGQATTPARTPTATAGGATGVYPGAGGVPVRDATTGMAPEPSATPWSWIKMPKITMPKIEMPKMPADPLAPVKSSARKVSDGAKRAWEGTKELFTFGGNGSAEQPTERVASRPDQPSAWSRMFGGGEPEPEGPQTVADWMAQPRPE